MCALRCATYLQNANEGAGIGLCVGGHVSRAAFRLSRRLSLPFVNVLHAFSAVLCIARAPSL